MAAAFEAVPNFSEGRDEGLIAQLGAGSRVLDVHSDPDHHRSVVTLAAASPGDLVEELVARVALAVERIDLLSHAGVHPRVGVADVVPLVPLGRATMDEAVAAARRLGERLWRDLGLPVFYYAEAAGGRTLAEIRRGRLPPDLGGPGLHPAAGAVCVGARPPLVAYNVNFRGLDLQAVKRIAQRMRELPGVQALVFTLAAGRVQLSMNLTHTERAGVQEAYDLAVRLAGQPGQPELVGLCPAAAAGPGCDGGLLEARLAAVAAQRAAEAALERGREEDERLAAELSAAALAFAWLRAAPQAMREGAERATAIASRLQYEALDDPEPLSFLKVAAAGLVSAGRS